jgi:hypothetical protein
MTNNSPPSSKTSQHCFPLQPPRPPPPPLPKRKSCEGRKREEPPTDSSILLECAGQLLASLLGQSRREIQDIQELTVEGNRQGIRDWETDTCQRFRTLSSLQRRVIVSESETGRQTHYRDSGQLVAYSGGE